MVQARQLRKRESKLPAASSLGLQPTFSAPPRTNSRRTASANKQHHPQPSIAVACFTVVGVFALFCFVELFMLSGGPSATTIPEVGESRRAQEQQESVAASPLVVDVLSIGSHIDHFRLQEESLRQQLPLPSSSSPSSSSLFQLRHFITVTADDVMSDPHCVSNTDLATVADICRDSPYWSLVDDAVALCEQRAAVEAISRHLQEYYEPPDYLIVTTDETYVHLPQLTRFVPIDEVWAACGDAPLTGGGYVFSKAILEQLTAPLKCNFEEEEDLEESEDEHVEPQKPGDETLEAEEADGQHQRQLPKTTSDSSSWAIWRKHACRTVRENRWGERFSYERLSSSSTVGLLDVWYAISSDQQNSMAGSWEETSFCFTADSWAQHSWKRYSLPVRWGRETCDTTNTDMLIENGDDMVESRRELDDQDESQTFMWGGMT